MFLWKKVFSLMTINMKLHRANLNLTKIVWRICLKCISKAAAKKDIICGFTP